MKNIKLISSAVAIALFCGSALAQDCAQTFGQTAEAFPAELASCTAGTALPNDPEAATDTAFVNLLFAPGGSPPTGIHSHVLNNFPASLTFRGATNAALFSMDFDSTATTLFAAVASTNAATPNNRTIGTINQSTGAYTVVAPLTGFVDPVSVESALDLVIHPLTDETFLLTNAGTPPNITTRLYRVNRTTGALTLVGAATGQQSFMIDAAMNCDGQLFGHQFTSPSTPSRLVSINPATGAVTPIGPTGFPANFAQGMDFDADTGTLYMYHFFGTSASNTILRYGTVNLSTGALTPIFSTAVGSGLELEGSVRSTCANADLSITKTAQVPANLGLNQNFTYTLTVQNNGPGNAANVVVTDPIQTGQTYVSNNCGATFASGVVTWNIAALSNGASQTCVLTVQATQPGALRNTATVTAAGSDPVPGNNSVTITIGGVVLPVPTLNYWGLGLLLVGLMAGAGFLMTRRA